MPDGGGGGGQQQSSSSFSTSTSGPSPVIAPKLENILQDFWGWYGNNANAPAYYPGQSFVPMSSATKSAFDALASRNSDLSTINAAQGSLADTLGGKYLDMGNPYLSGLLDAQFGRQNQKFNEETMPALNKTFGGAGRTGGGAHAATAVKLASELDRNQKDATAMAVAGEYGNERSRMLQAAGLAPQIDAGKSTLQGQDIMGRLQAAQGAEAYTGREIADNMARYNYAQTAQPEWLARMSQLIQSMYQGGQTSGSSNAYGASGGGGGGGWLGPALGVAGTVAKFAPLIAGISDARAKDVRQRVGFTDDGLPLYLYRYKGDDQPRIGPMAQEVAQVKPDAIARHPSGYLMVDYRKAMPQGGLI